jgi:hypothetical protein
VLVRVVQPPVTVTCAGCGGYFTITRRNMRGHEERGTEPRCADCRRGGRNRLVREKASPVLQAWWFDELGRDQALQLSRTIWPPA